MSRFDVTFFEDDDVTPFFGVGDGSGGVIEADFSTDPAHTRPYLGEVKNWSATQIDFAAGSSTLGALTVDVIDKRTDSSDQATGILTTRARDANGKRCLLRRLHPMLGMVPAFNGTVQSITLGGSPEGLVKYTIQLRDIRERERNQPIFTSNYVLFGGGAKDGPGDDYGALPGGGFMVEAVAPYKSVVAGSISHFQRGFGSGPGLAWGVAPVSPSDIPRLKGLGWPTQDADGIWRHHDVQIRWRAKDSGDPWTTLRDMPRSAYGYVLTLANLSPLAGLTSFLPSAPTIYFASDDEYDIPEDGEEIEFQILAVDISEDTPFWWDDGSFGDLLKEIYDGEHSRNADSPRVLYDPTAMAAFQAATPRTRFKLTEPVEDMRTWVEKNIYAPCGYAPALDSQKRVSPVAWALPDNLTAVPILNAENVVPVAGWQLGADGVINTVNFSYIRESIDPLKTTMQEVSTRTHWWQVWNPTKQVEVPDPSDVRAPWERVIETVVHDDGVDVASLATFGAKKITLEPVTVRTNGNLDGSPASGDVLNETGALLARNLRAVVLARFANGAPVVNATVLASDPAVQDLKEGDWVRLRCTYLVGDEGIRDLREYAQVTAISDDDPSVRSLTLVLSGVPDQTADDDETGTGTAGTDCLGDSGGFAFPGANGKTIRIFSEDGFIVNACDRPIDVDLVLVGGGGGGGGGVGGAGGGGGAGGVLGVGTPVTVTIPASSSVPITVGEGGGPNANGEDTIVWLNRVTGAVMDPETDDPANGYRAFGGGHGSTGDGSSGGSGGAGGGASTTSGGHHHSGGTETSGQGHDGGGGSDEGGTATCKTAAGGGGGSFAAGGSAGVAYGGSPGMGSSENGIGGPSQTVDGWGIVLGGGGDGAIYEVPGGLGPVCGTAVVNGGDGEPGAGYGGGGGANGVGTAGGDGLIAVRYAGARLKLVPPEITSSTTTDQNQQRICIEGGDFPPGALDVAVRVDYAIGDTEPDPDSGAWLPAGTLTAPGCVVTPPVPTGAKVWSRAVATAPGYLPSAPGDPVSTATPATPALLSHQLVIASGVGTVTWRENANCDAVRVRWLVHALGDDTTPPLANSQDVDASDRTFTIPDAVPRGSYLTVDIEAWADNTYADFGRSYRMSEENTPPVIATSGESIDFFSDVELSDPGESGEVEVLSPDGYGTLRNRPVRLDEWAAPEDNTDLNASTSAHGLMPKLSGDTTKYVSGAGTEESFPDLWTKVVAANDQDVTNNSSPQNDAELFFPVAAGAVYEIELNIVYAGSDTNGFRYGVSWPSSLGAGRFFGDNDGAGGAYSSGQLTSGETSGFLGGFASYTVGTTGSGTYNLHMLEGRIMLRVNTTGTFRFLFANKDATSGRVSRRKAGSVLRYRQIA